MGFTNEEDSKSDWLALKDSLILLKFDIYDKNQKMCRKRIEYILEQWFNETE